MYEAIKGLRAQSRAPTCDRYRMAAGGTRICHTPLPYPTGMDSTSSPVLNMPMTLSFEPGISTQRTGVSTIVARSLAAT